MNITRETTGPQTATLRVEIVPEDYNPNVQKTLKEYQRKANIPGFRPGHVPAGMIRKMYGKAMIADEVNKILTDSLTNYIRDEKLNILGNPIPNKEKTQSVSFEEGETMEFYFDLGFAPEIGLVLDNSIEVENYSIEVDEEMVKKYIEETRRRFGTYEHPEVSEENDMVSGEAIEVDADGKPVDGGLTKNIFFTTEKVTSETARQKLLGLKKGEQFVFSPVEFLGSIEEAVRHIGFKKDELEKPGLRLAFTLQDIVHLVPAELNSEFYEKVYPGENLEDFEAFRERVVKDAAGSFTAETDKMLFNQVSEALIKKAGIQLPDEFMMRWLQENNDTNMPSEEIASQYPAFADSMRWQLIENKIIRDHQIQVTDEDIKAYIRTVLLRQVDTGTMDPEAEKRYDSIVNAFMQNKEQVQRINDQLYNARLLEVFKSTLTINNKEVSYDDFIKLVSEKHQHDHEHDHSHHDHDHDHEHGHSH